MPANDTPSITHGPSDGRKGVPSDATPHTSDHASLADPPSSNDGPLIPKDQCLAALTASAARWSENVDTDDPKAIVFGTRYCPLCTLFYDHSCKNCPVSAATGETNCKSTPYFAAVNALHEWRIRPENALHHDAWRTQARREADFLVGLVASQP